MTLLIIKVQRREGFLLVFFFFLDRRIEINKPFKKLKRWSVSNTRGTGRERGTQFAQTWDEKWKCLWLSGGCNCILLLKDQKTDLWQTALYFPCLGRCCGPLEDMASSSSNYKQVETTEGKCTSHELPSLASPCLWASYVLGKEYGARAHRQGFPRWIFCLFYWHAGDVSELRDTVVSART